MAVVVAAAVVVGEDRSLAVEACMAYNRVGVVHKAVHIEAGQGKAGLGKVGSRPEEIVGTSGTVGIAEELVGTVADRTSVVVALEQQVRLLRLPFC